MNGELLEKSSKSLLGLTEQESLIAISKSLVKRKKLDIPTLIKEKTVIIKESGLLEYYNPDTPISVGGLEYLQEWITKRKIAFSDAAQEYGIDSPKGLLLVGVQGCGKSLICKSMANAWQMPMMRLDIGRLFGSLVGETEKNTRKVLATAEAMAPDILWIDEIEKGMAGVSSSGELDNGVTAKMFSTFLTWMQERKAPVFVVATANNCHSLPPEMLRKGRFDDIFFVDLPNPQEREAIIKIHITKRKRDIAKFDINDIASKTNNFSGAEIEAAIVAAMLEAFSDNGREVNTEDIIKAVKETKPLYETAKESIEDLRTWAADRTRRASKKHKESSSDDSNGIEM